MRNLLTYEFRKLFRNPLFYILFGVMVAMIAIQAISYRVVNDLLVPVIEGAADEDNALINMMTLSASQLYMQCLNQSQGVTVIAVFTALLALSDNSGPIKNVLSRGYSRTQVFFSKYLCSLAAAMMYSILIIAVSYPLIGAIMSMPNDLPDNAFVLLLGQVVAVAATHAVFYMVSVLLGNIVGSIFANILGPSLLGLVFALIDVIAQLGDKEVTVSSFWVGNLLNSFACTTDSFTMQFITPTNTQMIIAFAMSAVYIALGIFLGNLFANKKQY